MKSLENSKLPGWDKFAIEIPTCVDQEVSENENENKNEDSFSTNMSTIIPRRGLQWSLCDHLAGAIDYCMATARLDLSHALTAYWLAQSRATLYIFKGEKEECPTVTIFFHGLKSLCTSREGFPLFRQKAGAVCCVFHVLGWFLLHVEAYHYGKCTFTAMRTGLSVGVVD